MSKYERCHTISFQVQISRINTAKNGEIHENITQDTCGMAKMKKGIGDLPRSNASLIVLFHVKLDYMVVNDGLLKRKRKKWEEQKIEC